MDATKNLYDTLTKDGYDLGDFDHFKTSLSNPDNAKNLHDAITKDGYDVGDINHFTAKLGIVGAAKPSSPMVLQPYSGKLPDNQLLQPFGKNASNNIPSITPELPEFGLNPSKPSVRTQNIIKPLPAPATDSAMGASDDTISKIGEVQFQLQALDKKNQPFLNRYNELNDKLVAQSATQGTMYGQVSMPQGNPLTPEEADELQRMQPEYEKYQLRKQHLQEQADPHLKAFNQNYIAPLINTLETEKEKSFNSESAIDALNPLNGGTAKLQSAIDVYKQLSKTIDLPTKSQGEGFLSGLKPSTDIVASLSGLGDLSKNININSVIKKFNADPKSLTNEDLVLLHAKYLSDTFSGMKSQSIASQVGSSALESIPYMLQFIATDGIGTAARGGAEGALAKLAANKSFAGWAQKEGMRRIGSLVSTGVQDIAETAARTVAMPSAYGMYNEKRAGQLTKDNEGNIISVNQKSPLIAALQTGIENYSEIWGKSVGDPLFTKVFNKISPSAALSETFRKSFLGRAINATTDFQRMAEIQGGISEYAEEKVADLLNIAIGEGTWKDFFDGEQNTVTLFSTLAIQGGMKVAALPSIAARELEVRDARKKLENEITTSSLPEHIQERVAGAFALPTLEEQGKALGQIPIQHLEPEQQKDLNALIASKWNYEILRGATSSEVNKSHVEAAKERSEQVYQMRVQQLQEQNMNRDTQTFMVAQLHGEDNSQVEVLGGNISQNEDGTINHENSAPYFYARTTDGSVQQFPTTMLSTIVSNQSTDEVFSIVRQQVDQETQQLINEIANPTIAKEVSQAADMEEQQAESAKQETITSISVGSSLENKKTGEKYEVIEIKPDGRLITNYSENGESKGQWVFNNISEWEDTAQSENYNYNPVKPSHNPGDVVTFTDEAGNPMEGKIQSDFPEDNAYLILDANNQIQSIPYDRIAAPAPSTDALNASPESNASPITSEVDKTPQSQNTDTSTTSPTSSLSPNYIVNASETPIDRIPRDEKGKPVFHHPDANPHDVAQSLLDLGEGDTDLAIGTVNANIKDTEAKLKQLVDSDGKQKFTTDPVKNAENKKLIVELKRQLNHWDEVATNLGVVKNNIPEIPATAKQRIQNLGDYLSVRDYVLRQLASGQKFHYSDKGASVGLRKETGLSHKELLPFLNQANGTSVSAMAEDIYANAQSYGIPLGDMSENDIRSEIIDALSSVKSPADALIQAEEIRKQNAIDEEEYLKAQSELQQMREKVEQKVSEVETAFDNMFEEALQQNALSEEDYQKLMNIFVDARIEEEQSALADYADMDEALQSITNIQNNGKQPEQQQLQPTEGEIRNDDTGERENTPGENGHEPRNPNSIGAQHSETQSTTGSTLDAEIAAQNPNTNPTEAQKESGDYRKAHIEVLGMPITIENPKGSTRSGVSEDGKAWSNTLHSHYGEFDNTTGYDGDPIDVFVGDNPESNRIFVVDQVNPKTGEFDESKVMVGYNTPKEAREAYFANYEANWQGFGALSEADVPQFKTWLYDGKKQRKPYSEYVDTIREHEARKTATLDSITGGEYSKAVESKMNDSWRKEFERAKAENDLPALDILYNKVKVALNGLAQGKGEATVKAFEALKKEIEDYHAELYPDKYANKTEQFNLEPTVDFDSLERNIAKILTEYSGRGMAAVEVEAYLNEHKELAKEYLDNYGLKTRDELRSKLASLQTKLRAGKGKQKAESKAAEQQRKAEQSVSEIEKMGIEAEAKASEQSDKQPWEMTKEEFNQNLFRPSIALVPPKNGDYTSRDAEAYKIHANIVQQALSEGKPVPENVLNEYPDLKKTKQTTTQPTEKIEDFGEKIEGARKDQLRKYYNKINLNGTTLSTIFPKPNFKELLESGLTVRQASAVKVAYEWAQQEKKYKSRSKERQLDSIRFYAAYAKTALSENLNIEFINNKWQFTDYGKAQLQLRASAYEKVAQDLGLDYLDLDLSKVSIKEMTPEYTKMLVNKPAENEKYEVRYYVSAAKRFATAEEAFQEFVDQIKANTKTDVVNYKRKLNVYYDRTDRTVHYIGYQPTGKPVIKLKEGFASAREAFDYKKENEADLQAMLERIMLENKSETKRTVTRLKYTNETARDRIGKDWREGKDVTSENFAKQFGFRGVEYGNWVNQKERQVFLNNTYDSFMDLAQMLGISPAAISLNGKLAITFGSRGSGGISAHYEPEKTIINLTKTKGLGSLAHEWFHAVDNYFAGFEVTANGMKSAVFGQFKPGTRPEVQSAFTNMYDVMAGPYKQRSRTLDMQKSKVYFALPYELAARAFENYVLTRLNESGQVNDFLANYVSPEDWKGDAQQYPYPIGEESRTIADAFQNLFDTIQEDENGALYQKTIAQFSPISEQQLTHLIDTLRLTGLATDVKTGDEFWKRLSEITGEERLSSGDSNPNFHIKTSPIGFYSTVEKALSEINQEKGTKDQFKAMLLKNGAKQAEMDWMGFDELPDRLTKSDIQNWIDENRIDVQEVEKGMGKAINPDNWKDEGFNGATRLFTNEGWEISQRGDEFHIFKPGGEKLPSYWTSLEGAKARVQDHLSTDGDTKYSQYVLPGGENYKELLLTMPNKARELMRKASTDYYEALDLLKEKQKEALKQIPIKESYKNRIDFDLKKSIIENLTTHSADLNKWGRQYIEENEDFNKLIEEAKDLNKKVVSAKAVLDSTEKVDNFTSTHFEEQNILAHIRFDEREVNGERVLFIEEFQSDWAQEGKKKGFNTKPKYVFSGGKYIVYESDGKYFDDTTSLEEAKNMVSHLSDNTSGTIPDMPFKKTDQWVNLAMRRMMRYAVENGFDRIAWTTGEQQADRYDLSKQVDEIAYTKDERGYNVGVSKNGTLIEQKNHLSESDLEQQIGKELARKIVDGEFTSKKNNANILSGFDLKIGGEGMKAFYDGIVPAAIGKLGKPFGAKVEIIDIRAKGTKKNEKNFTDFKESLLFEKELTNKGYFPISTVEANGTYTIEWKTSEVQSIPVTDKMRESASEGMPLFQIKSKNLSPDEMKAKQLGIISKYNPAPNNYNTWIRNQSDIKTASEAFQSAFEEGNMYPDFTVEDMKQALETGKVTIYSSHPINKGKFVTPSRINAQEYAGGGKVYSKEVKLTDVAWIDESEGQYAPVQQLRTPDGTVYGFVDNTGTIYLNPEQMNANTPIHEFGHLWVDSIKGTELYQRGAALIRQSEYWKQVNSDPNYAHLTDEQKTDEAMAAAIGDKGEQVVNNTLWARIKAWISDVWTRIGAQFGKENLTPEQIQNLSLNDFTDIAVSELLSEKELKKTAFLDSITGGEYSKVKSKPLPEHITVDGVERPTTNSNGKLIHATEQGVHNFWKWFGSSVTVNENGEPIVFYHGTPKGGFFIFRDESYFTDNKSYAERYKNPNASSMSYKSGQLNPELYETYLSIKNPFDTRNSKERNIFLNEFYMKYGNGSPLSERGVPDWTDATDLLEFINEKGYKYDGLILDEGGDGGYGENVVLRGFSFVPVSPNQIKSATGNNGSFDPNKPDIRFQIIGERGASALDKAEEATTRIDNLNIAKQMSQEIVDKPARIEKLRNSKPVEITGEEYKGKYELDRDSVKKFIKDNLRGEYVNQDTNDVISVFKDGAQKVTSHSMGNEAHLKSIIAIPDLIKNSIFMGELGKNRDDKKYDRYRYYVVGLKIGGEDYTAKLTIGVDAYGNKYYDHSLTEIEKGKLIDEVGALATTLPSNKENTLSEYKDSKLIEILQIPDVKSIRLATGWEKGVDGLWRYEVPDVELINFYDWINSNESMKLSDIVSDNELFTAYPSLKDITIKIKKSALSESKGSYDANTNTIELSTSHLLSSTNIENSIRSTLIHEIQHAIQHIEGFAKGGNPRQFRRNESKENEMLKEYTDAANKYAESEEGKAALSDRDAIFDKMIFGEITRDEMHNQISELSLKYPNFNQFLFNNSMADRIRKAKRLSAEEMYINLAGETEARNASARMNLTPEERREQLLSQTADVAPEDQIVIMDNLGISESRVPVSENKEIGIDNIAERMNAEYAKKADRLVIRGKARISGKYLSAKEWTEAWQDRLISVKDMQDAIAEAEGRPIKAYENAYDFENTLSSRNMEEMTAMTDHYLRPLARAAKAVNDAGIDLMEVGDYVKMKHGLERNNYFRQKEANDWLEDQKKKIPFDPQLEKDMYDRTLAEAENKARSMANNDKDYSGLTGLGIRLYGLEKMDESFFSNKVSEYEKQVGEEKINTLWSAFRNSNEATMGKWMQAGMISKDSYQNIMDMFEYYVPLRGFTEETMDDLYEYYGEPESSFQSPLKKAKGRKTEADDPFGHIAQMMQSSIVGGNKNLMKQKLLNLVRNHPNDYATISKVWFEYKGNDADGHQIWEQAQAPVVDEELGGEEAMTDRNNEFVKSLNERQVKDPTNPQIGETTYEVNKLQGQAIFVNRQNEEHIVKVSEAGEKYQILFNGSPRPAQAINGLNDEDRVENKVITAMQRLNRQMAANFTTRNPAFVVANLVRDYIYVSQFASPGFTKEFLNPANDGAIRRYLSDRQDLNEESDRYFAEFLQFGGETGYTAMFNIDHYKKMMADYQKNNGEEKSIAIARWMRNANRWAEDKTRFAAYVNERKHGKTVVEAIKVAKECSVNFNRKGSGKMGNTSARVIWLFLNAGIQGMSNFYKRFKANPVKTSTTVLGKWIAMGAIAPWLNSMLMGLFGKDDDDYWNLTDYQRKNNICIYIPYTEKSFAMIPIPIELRAFYGMGESMHAYFAGREDGSNTTISIAKGLSDLFPINPTEGGSGLIPASVKPFWEIYTNENFTGIPIVNENIDKNAPEYKRVYSNTNKGLVEASKALNNISGGDVATPGIFNINPAVIEHLFDGYFGGVSMTASQAVKTAMMPFGKQEVETRSIPVVSRFVGQSNENTASGRYAKKYFEIKDELEKLNSRDKLYNKAMMNGEAPITETIGKIRNIYTSPEYKSLQLLKTTESIISKANNLIKQTDISDEQEKQQRKIISDARRDFVNRYNDINK